MQTSQTTSNHHPNSASMGGLIMQCNIGVKGKAYRLKLGILGSTIGIIVTLTFFVVGIEWGIFWLIPTGIIAGGAFSIFEGWAGWCVIRAIGFKTPL